MNVIFDIGFVSKIPPRNLTAEQKNDYINKRKFYDWTADFNFPKYILNEDKVVKNKDFEDYASRQGNLGLFDTEKVLTAEDVDEVRTALRNTNSNIWHGFISFDEKFNERFEVQKQAMDFLKKHFNDFLQRTHLDKDNICLVASLHKDTEHRHIHFSFFEKEARTVNKNGEITYSSKGSFRKNVLDNWFVSLNMAMEDNQDVYSSRDAVLLKLREMKATIGKEFTDQEIQIRLLSLAGKFQGSGRLQYWSKDMNELRPEIDQLTKFILCSSPYVKEEHQRFLRALNSQSRKVTKIKKETNKNTNEPASDITYMRDLRAEYYGRVGNAIIGLAREMKYQYFAAYYKESSKQKRVAARQTREHAKRVYTNFSGKLLNTLGQIQKNMEAEFLGTVSDAEHLINEMIMEEARDFA